MIDIEALNFLSSLCRSNSDYSNWLNLPKLQVRLDKVDPMYMLVHPNSRVNIKEDTRIRMTTEEAEEWKNGISKSTMCQI